MKSKKFIIVLVLILFVALTSIALVQAKNVEEPPTVDAGQIVYDGKTLTNSSYKKAFPALSPDKQQIAFVYNIYADEEGQPVRKIGLVDVKSGQVTDIKLENNSSTGFLYLEWLNNNRIGVISHINPSLEEYDIIDATSGIQTEQHFGVGFSWLGDRLYFNKPRPHFADGDKGKNKIMDDKGGILYESPDNVMIIGGPNFDEQGKSVAFFEYDTLNEEVTLVVGDHLNDKSIKINKKMKWHSDIGRVKWDNANEVKIGSQYHIVKFNLDSEQIVGDEKTPEAIKLEQEFEQRHSDNFYDK